MDLAERIQERLGATGLNPYSAALKAGLGASFVRDILRGKVKNPSAQRLGRLAEALDTTLHYLLGAPEPEITLADWRGNPLPPPPAPTAPTPEGLKKTPLLLPVRFELYGDTFRKAADVTRAVFGYEAATLPTAYQGRETWFELVADDTADLVVPKGSLVQVVSLADAELNTLGQDDLVIVTKRHVGPDSAFHYIERSLRQVNERWPGYWFYEFPSFEKLGDSDDLISFSDNRNPRAKDDDLEWGDDEPDDVPSIRELVEEFPPEQRDHYLGMIDEVEKALREVRAERQAEKEAARQPSTTPEQRERFIQRVNAAFAPENRENFLKDMENLRKRSAKLAGKVIRVLRPLDARAGFGF